MDGLSNEGDDLVRPASGTLLPLSARLWQPLQSRMGVNCPESQAFKLTSQR